MNKDTFAGFHPAVNMLYFACVIGFSMFFMHPINLAISLICAFAYAIYLNGKRAIKFGLFFMLPMMLMTAILNPLFNHQGVTILAYLPNGNPLTLESIMFGIAASVVLVTVIAWFSCFNSVMTSDKFVYLLGRIIPALSLVFSMALRFVPRFIAQLKIVLNAQKCVGQNASEGNIFKKAKHGVRVLSIMITWALENSIETADSMKARGYGLSGRTAFAIFHFDKRDAIAVAYILFCTFSVIAGAALEVFRFRYFPTIMHISGESAGFWTALLFVIYFALCVMPLTTNLREDLLWKRLELKT